VSHSVNNPDTGPTTSFYEGVAVGIERERERIIKLAQNRICFDHKIICDHAGCYSLSELIELIKEGRSD